jgi:hypothetical protein
MPKTRPSTAEHAPSPVKSRIMAACKKFGIDVNEGGEGESNAAHFAPDLDVVGRRRPGAAGGR